MKFGSPRWRPRIRTHFNAECAAPCNAPPRSVAAIFGRGATRCFTRQLRSLQNPSRRLSRVAFDELARAGVRTVGESHYIHHQADGTPYDDRTLLSEIVIEAAKAAGLRIALLRVAYHRAGPWRDAEPGQRRFCDPSVDAVIRCDVEKLCKNTIMIPTSVSGSRRIRCAVPVRTGFLRSRYGNEARASIR